MIVFYETLSWDTIVAPRRILRVCRLGDRCYCPAGQKQCPELIYVNSVTGKHLSEGPLPDKR